MKASYTLTVINKPALKVSLAKQSYKKGETVKMTAVITGTGYKNTEFSIQKKDGPGAGIVYEGTAKAGKTVSDSWNTKNADPGTYEAVAAVYGEDGAELQSAGSTFTVTVPVTGLKLNNTKLSLEKGDTFQLTAVVSPPNANQAVSYKTSNSSVASVDQNGLITAKKAGKVTITAAAKDGGKKATCTVTVSQYQYNVNKLVNAAVKYLGTIEDPPDSNLIFFNDWYFGKTGMAVPWCGVFVTKVIYDAGMIGTTWGSLNTARKSVAEGVRNYKTLAKRQKRWITSGYKRGDIVLFDWQSDGGYDHIAIIESVSESGKTITTIEGNTSDPEGIQTGDVGVYRKTRAVNGQVLGAYRPPYEK
jgi:translation initiation factor 1 (eIF-1/SUI1)